MVKKRFLRLLPHDFSSYPAASGSQGVPLVVFWLESWGFSLAMGSAVVVRRQSASLLGLGWYSVGRVSRLCPLESISATRGKCVCVWKGNQCLLLFAWRRTGKVKRDWSRRVLPFQILWLSLGLFSPTWTHWQFQVLGCFNIWVRICKRQKEDPPPKKKKPQKSLPAHLLESSDPYPLCLFSSTCQSLLVVKLWMILSRVLSCS